MEYPRSNLIFLSLHIHSFIRKTFKSIVGYSRYNKRKHCMTTVQPHVRPQLPCDHLTKTPKCSQSPSNQNLSLKRPPHRSDRDHFFLAWRFCCFQYCLWALVSGQLTHDVVSAKSLHVLRHSEYTKKTNTKLTRLRNLEIACNDFSDTNWSRCVGTSSRKRLPLVRVSLATTSRKRPLNLSQFGWLCWWSYSEWINHLMPNV